MRNALHGEVLPLLRPREAVTARSIVGGGQTTWLVARTTKPAQEAANRFFPRGLFAVEALSAIAQVEETLLPVWLLLLVLEVWHDAAVGNGVHGQAQDGVVAGLGQNFGHMALHGAFRQA